ncbi:MAG: citrate synthase family protein [Caldilineaceae bacterium]|nr:citrate synthase family protein [Caldilineaceae bacterium]
MMLPNTTYLTATQAAEYLGVSPATLYSYVSRGLLRSEPAGANSRSRRYLASDVYALRQRKEQRRNPATVAAAVLDFGEPVLNSGITLILGGQLYYRGYDATHLAREHSFERVANLLWTGELSEPSPAQPLPASWLALLDHVPPQTTPLAALQSLLPLVQTLDPSAHDISPSAVARLGQAIIQLLIAIIGGNPRAPSVVDGLLSAWQPSLPNAAALLNAMLILTADHELNISSFTARCVASTGAPPHAALAAALGALQGPRHGGQTLRCEAFLREVAWDGPQAVTNRLRRGDHLPGFGHMLYPDGDPRGHYLTEAALAVAPDSSAASVVRTARDTVFAQVGQEPSLDFGLVAAGRILGLPSGAPLLIFALGRIAGWIGHMIEQYQADHLIRPRARYNGPQPRLE